MDLKFRDYQRDIAKRGVSVIKRYGFLYLSMEVRTGKTLTSLGIAWAVKSKKVLFVTKKKAIPSIKADYDKLNPEFSIYIINYESLHKIDDMQFDLIILDEAHTLGAFPKPSLRAKQVKALISKLNSPKVILLSGTPTPESFSQMYHQVYGIPNNPFRYYKNFYRFADDYVVTFSRELNGFKVTDYSNGMKEIIEMMEPYTISYTQKQAGFTSEIEEEILYVPMAPKTLQLCKDLSRDLVVEMEDGEVILADTGVKLMSKIHQMCSGTVKFESGNSKVLDLNKAKYIKWKFQGDKIGIYYKFVAELEALKEVFGDQLCTTLEEFDSTDKNIALQIVSGREGISLRNAKYIVFYNIDFSATSYWQARDRMTTMNRLFNKVYWIFSEKGIERKIYKTVIGKKDYTLRHFKRHSIERKTGRV